MSTEYNTRETLLLKLKNRHDDLAWQEFSDIYHRFICSIIMKMGVAHSECDDIAQDVLLKAWKALPDFEYDPNKGKFRTWLSTVCANTVRTYFKRHNRKSALFSDEEKELAIDSELDKISLIEWKKFISERAWDTVKPTLSEQVCRIFERISTGEDMHNIADDLDIPYNTVCVYKKRVINKLTKVIHELNVELG